MNIIKHLAYSATCMALAAIGLTSCSQEDMPDATNREGMVDVVMTTSMPQGLESYAVNSAQGGLKNLENKGYSVRYVMEIYPKNSTERVSRMIKYVPMTTGGSYRTTSFNTRLLAAEYNFVFFADIVRQVNSYPYDSDQRTDAMFTGMNLTKPYYANRYFFSNTDETSDVLVRPTNVDQAVEGDLQTIAACPTATDTFQNPSLEMYDAYSCTASVDLRTEPTTQSFTLKRPFAKLRLITTDADKLLATPDWSKTRVSITVSDIPTGFNALSGTSIAAGEYGYWTGALHALNSDIYSDEDESTSDKTVGVFYLPVPANAQNLTFTISVKDAAGNFLAQGIKLEVENVPLVGNKLTTIKGNLLSKNATVNVTIDDEFEKDDEGNIDETIIEYGKEASSVEELKSKLSGKDEAIMYTAKVTKDEGFELDFTNVARTAPVYAENNNATLTLGFASIEEGAVLTFKGSNAPKNLRIKTDTKCSLRIDLASSDVYYDGSTYKYIVTNSGCSGSKSGVQYDAIFGAGDGDRFYPADYTNAHNFKINADFTLPSDLKCVFVKRHENQTCSFIETLQSWINNNSGKPVWDFVGDTNN